MKSIHITFSQAHSINFSVTTHTINLEANKRSMYIHGNSVDSRIMNRFKGNFIDIVRNPC